MNAPPRCPEHDRPGRYAWGSMVVCDDCYAPPSAVDDGAAPLPARTALRPATVDDEGCPQCGGNGCGEHPYWYCPTYHGVPVRQTIDLGFDFSDVRALDIEGTIIV